MKRVRIAAFVALLACIAPASARAAAQSMLAWDGCAAYDGVSNKSFACDVNTGSERIWCSVQPHVDMPRVIGVELVFDFLMEPGTPVPGWWQFRNSGTCRQTSLSLEFNLSPEPANDYCATLFSAGAMGGVSAAIPNYSSNPERLRILGVFAVAQASARPVSADSIYNVAVLVIDHAKTTGAGACTGCATAACGVLNYFKLAQPVGEGDQSYTSYGEHSIVWQSAVPQCPASIPTRRSTWGSLKSLYR